VNFDSIVLYREGLFWRAYERSAYNFVKHIKAFPLPLVCNEGAVVGRLRRFHAHGFTDKGVII